MRPSVKCECEVSHSHRLAAASPSEEGRNENFGPERENGEVFGDSPVLSSAGR